LSLPASLLIAAGQPSQSTIEVAELKRLEQNPDVRVVGPARTEFGVFHTGADHDARDADEKPLALLAAEHDPVEHGSVGERQAWLGNERLGGQVHDCDRGFTSDFSCQVTKGWVVIDQPDGPRRALRLAPVPLIQGEIR